MTQSEAKRWWALPVAPPRWTVVLGSVTRIRGDYLLGVAAKPIRAGGER